MVIGFSITVLRGDVHPSNKKRAATKRGSSQKMLFSELDLALDIALELGDGHTLLLETTFQQLFTIQTIQY